MCGVHTSAFLCLSGTCFLIAVMCKNICGIFGKTIDFEGEVWYHILDLIEAKFGFVNDAKLKQNFREHKYEKQKMVLQCPYG